MNAQEQARLFAQIQNMLFSPEPAQRKKIKELKHLLELYQEKNPSIDYLLPLIDAVIAFRAKSAPGLFAKLRKAAHRQGDEERTLQTLANAILDAQDVKKALETSKLASSKPDANRDQVIELFDAVLSFSRLSVDARIGNLQRRNDPIFTAYDQEKDKKNNISLKSTLSKIAILEKKSEQSNYAMIDDVVDTAQEPRDQKTNDVDTQVTNYDFMPTETNNYVGMPSLATSSGSHYAPLPDSISTSVIESSTVSEKELDLVNSDIEYIGGPFSTGAYGVIQRCRYKGYDQDVKALCDDNGCFIIKRLKAGATPESQEDLRKEAQAGEQLFAHHANSQDYNLVRLGNINGEFVIVSRMEVFEFIDGKPTGKSADSYLQSLATLPTDNAVNVPHLSYSEISIAQMFSTMWTSVNAMHDARVVHGDIALRNFLLKQTSFAADEESLLELKAVIMDYGFSRAMNEKGLVASPYLGRNAPIRWLSQAAILGMPLNALTDLYATKVSMLTAIGIMAGMNEKDVICFDPENNSLEAFGVVRAKKSDSEALMIFYNNVAARLEKINNPALNRLLDFYKGYIGYCFDQRKFRGMSEQQLISTIETERALDKAVLHQANEQFFVAELAVILQDAVGKSENETMRNAQRLKTLAFSAEFAESKAYQDFLKCQNVQQLSEVAYANWLKSQDIVSENTPTISEVIVLTTSINQIGGHYVPLSTIPTQENDPMLSSSIETTDDVVTSSFPTVSLEQAHELGSAPIPKNTAETDHTAYASVPSNSNYVSLQDVAKDNEAVRARKAAQENESHQQFSVESGFHGSGPSDSFIHQPISKSAQIMQPQQVIKELKFSIAYLEKRLRFFHPILSRLNFLEVGLTSGLKELASHLSDIRSQGIAEILIQNADSTDTNLQKEYQKIVRLLEMYINAVAKKTDKLREKIATAETVDEKAALTESMKEIIPSRFILDIMVSSSVAGKNAKQLLETKIQLREQAIYDARDQTQGWYGYPEVTLKCESKLDAEQFIKKLQAPAMFVELLNSDKKPSGYSIIYPTPSSQTALIVGKDRGDLKVVSVGHNSPGLKVVPLEDEMKTLLKQALEYVSGSKKAVISGNNTYAKAQCAEFVLVPEKMDAQMTNSARIAAPSA